MDPVIRSTREDGQAGRDVMKANRVDVGRGGGLCLAGQDRSTGTEDIDDGSVS
jgi:hypothetical protein